MTKGCLSRRTALAMVFKLRLSARKKWRSLSRRDGPDHLAEVIQGVTFEDGIEQIRNAARSTRQQLLAITPDHFLAGVSWLTRKEFCHGLKPLPSAPHCSLLPAREGRLVRGKPVGHEFAG